jgi:hypothetical protein
MRNVLFALAAMFLIAPAVFAQTGSPTITSGDVVTTPIPPSAIPEDALVFPLRIYDPALAVKFSASTIRDSATVAIDSSRNITLLMSSSRVLSQYNASLRWLGDRNFDERNPISFTVDNSGRAFILGALGQLSVIGKDGKTEQIIMLPDVFYARGNVDLAPDQCTLFYLDSKGRVRRFDVCQGFLLPDFASDIAGEYVRGLSDGGVAVRQGQKINFYDATGRLTYTLVSRFTGGFTFDSTPGTIWFVGYGAAKVRIADGAVLGFLESTDGMDKLAVVDEHRPSSANVVPPSRQRSVRR